MKEQGQFIFTILNAEMYRLFQEVHVVAITHRNHLQEKVMKIRNKRYKDLEKQRTENEIMILNKFIIK